MTSIGFMKIFPAFSLEDRDFLSWFIALALSMSAHTVFIFNKQELNVITPANMHNFCQRLTDVAKAAAKLIFLSIHATAKN